MSAKITEEYIEVNGIKEYTYQVMEEGLPIVLFVHGSGTPDSLFAYLQAKEYEGVCSCIYYDQRGSGKTYQANKNVIPNYRDMQQDLYETVQYFCKKYQKKRIFLVANSMGTLLSTPTVLKYPELFDGYLTSGFVVSMRKGEQYSVEVLKHRIREKMGASADKILASIEGYPRETFDKENTKLIGRARKLEENYGLNKPVSKEMKQILMNSPIFKYSDLFTMLKSAKTNQQLFEDIWDFDVTQLGRNYEVPVYFLHGEDDYIAPLPLAREYFDAVTAPKKEFVIIHHAGHMTGFDNVSEYNEAFLRIIGETFIG